MFTKLFVRLFLTATVMLYAFLLVLLIANSAHAEEPPLIQPDPVNVWLTTGEWSRHNNNVDCPGPGKSCQERYRQNNTGIGLQLDMDRDYTAVAGYYHNSIRNETFYIGGAWTPLHEGRAKFGVVGAMASGYWYTPIPIGGLYGTYEYERVGINLMWLPSVVMAIQFKVKLNN